MLALIIVAPASVISNRLTNIYLLGCNLERRHRWGNQWRCVQYTRTKNKSDDQHDAWKNRLRTTTGLEDVIRRLWHPFPSLL